MSEKISMDRFRSALDNRLSGLRPDAGLAQRIIRSDADEAPVRQKSVVLAAAVVLSLFVLAAGAVAAVLGGWGILHFADRPVGVCLPSGSEACIKQENLSIETECVECTIRESYYDGKLLRLAAQVVPKEQLLLIGGDASPADPMEEVVYANAATGMSYASYALENYGGKMADISLHAGANDVHSFHSNGDGSITVYTECVFDDELPKRDLQVKLVCMPVLLSADGTAKYDAAFRETVSVPMTFHALETKTYVCEEPLFFPAAGVRVVHVELTATPLEIRYAIDYEITDLNAYLAQNDALWFEFIDPESTESEYVAQRVSEGIVSSESVGRLDRAHFQSAGVGDVYRQTGSVGLDAFGDRYTIRAYHAGNKTRFETVTFAVSERRQEP